MSGGETVAVAFARAGLEMVLASVKAANDAERLEIETMLQETHAQLAAIPRLGPELDAITETHLARVRAKTEADAKARRADAVGEYLAGASAPGHGAAPVGFWETDARFVAALDAAIAAPADLPTEGEDPDE